MLSADFMSVAKFYMTAATRALSEKQLFSEISKKD